MTRRRAFLTAAVALLPLASSSVRVESQASPAAASSQTRPNILWITSEDNGPEYGAYGDTFATTPNIDGLAARGFRYRTAWSNGPVCGASRTALIAGMFPESNGGEHMRSNVRLPQAMRLYPALLREAGYYVTNNSKTDYNFPDPNNASWDESSPNAHWKNRRPGQPFFAVFNLNESHESQIRLRPHTWVHDVTKVPVPPYMPDVKETREDWAQYYDQISVIDGLLGQRIAELEAAGLADDTIIMHFGDHGSGMPRSKRYPYNSGLQVGVVVYIPPKFRALGPAEAARPGSESQRLVSFVDLAPTLLSLAGVTPPAWMQGKAFMGPYRTPDPEHIYGFRGRMDERYDLMRSVRDQRYVYIRNFMPHRPYGQYVEYMFQTPTTAVWKKMYDAGQLKPPQTFFWEPKPSEELYDLQTDKGEVNNLAGTAAARPVLERMRRALDAHEREIRDVGLMPEYELHRDETATTAYERGRDPKRYDFERVYAMAKNASDRAVPLATIRPGLVDADPVVRYWAANGVVIRGKDAVAATSSDLETLLADREPGPRIVAAEALARFGLPAERDRAIARLVEDGDVTRTNVQVAMLALYSLNQVTDLPDVVKQAVKALPTGRGAGAARATGAGRGGRAAAPAAPAAAGADQRGNYLPALIAAIVAGNR